VEGDEIKMTTEAKRATKEVISGPPGPGLPFSTAIAYGDLVFVSGLVGRDPVTRQIAIGDVRAQTAQALANIQAQLERAGSSLDRVLKATVFLTDMRLFGRMNEAYVAAFSTDPPARSCVAVTALPDEQAVVEIEVIATRR
jgi:2-iminobutanoate/2-iminopropanoate deaminase